MTPEVAAEEKPSASLSSSASDKPASGPLRFIRVFAPADRISDWPWGEMKYVPVEPAEFERLIQLGEVSASKPKEEAKISWVKMRASLSGATLLEGECTLRIQTPNQQGGLLRWPKWPLAVRTAAWVDAAGQPLEPALLGVNESGQMELATARTGQIRVEWSLQGQQDSVGLRFDLALPACGHTELVLDLPETLRPVLPGALIRPQGPPSLPGRKNWLLEWGGQMPGPLRLVGEEGTVPTARMLVQQENQYTLLPEGLEGIVRFTIQDLGEPVSELSLAVEAGLEVTAVKLAGQNLSWRWDPKGASGTRRLWVLLPQPIYKEAHSLQVEVVGPVVLDATWQLPRVTLEKTIWQQGTITVRIGMGLVVNRIGGTGWVQYKAEPASLGATPSGEYFEFQAYSPEATVELVLGRRQTLPVVDTGSVVMLSERQISARVRARVRTEAGEHFVLQAQVGRRWLIDAVEADPSTQVEDWTLEPASQRLTIRLTRPVTAQRPVILQIVARRLQSPIGRIWRSEELLPVRFVEVQQADHLVALCPQEGSYELICLTPDPTVPINPRQAEPKNWELVDKISEGVLFFATAQTQSLQWLLRPRLSQYRAKIHIDVVASAKSVSERYRIECIPEGGRLERVLIALSHGRPEPVQWSLSGDTERQWSLRRLTDKDLPTDPLPPGGEAWEIQLRPARSGAFIILGQRTSAFGGLMPVALASLPQAAHQEATVRVRSVGPEAPLIVSSRIQPIPSEREDFLPGWTAQVASFRYDPKKDLSTAQSSTLLLQAPQDLGAGRQCWAWQARLESWIQPSGVSRHIATYWLVNFHRSQLNIQIPSADAPPQLEGVWLGGQPARWQVRKTTEPPEALSIEVALSPQKTFSPLVVAFQTQQPPLRHRSKLAPYFPSLDVPVVSRSWTVWLPPTWQARYRIEYALNPNHFEISVRERLLGIWARAKHRQPFNPFSSEHWKSLFGQDASLQWERQKAEAFFQAVGALLLSGPSSPALADAGPTAPASRRWSWAQLLQHETVGQVGRILIDRQGLWEAGIDPSSGVEGWSWPAAEAEPADHIKARLAREAFWHARLALGLYQGMFLITSLERASGWQGWAENLGDPLVWKILPEAGDRLLELGKLGAEPLFVPPETWQESAEPSPVGVFGPAEWASGTGMLGWTAYQMELPESVLANQQWIIELLDQDQALGWYWTAFLIAGGLALLVAKRNGFWLLLAAGGLAVVALLVPDSWVAPVSGLFGAVLLVGIIKLLLRSTQPASGKADSVASGSGSDLPKASASSSSRRLLTVQMLLLAVLGGIEEAFGAETTTPVSSSAVSSLLYRVFIPIDENQLPTGDPYQVPEPFYQYLRRRAQTVAPSSSGWRLRQALYRGELNRSASSGRWEIPRLNLSWQCDLVGKPAQLSLPLVRTLFPIVPGTWQVEGQPVDPQWNEAGTLLTIPIPVSASSVSIEGQVGPVQWDQGGFQQTELLLPPTPQARLELGLPPDAPELHLEGAFGMVKRSAVPTPRLVAELGPAERLRLRWPSLPASEATMPEVDQLLWLWVQPGTVLLEARFRLSRRHQTGGGGMFRLMAENRLRMLGWHSPAAQGDIKISTSPGGQILEFPIRPSPADQIAVLAVRFLLTDSTGVGNLRLPKLDPLEVRVARRWLAVSVDPCLEYPMPPPNLRQPVPEKDFLELWGSAETGPQFIDTLSSSGQAWTLTTRPRTPNTSVEQILWLGYGEKTVRLYYEARLSTTSGSSFQHCIQTPPELQIETISILQANTSVPIRWVRSPDGKTTLFSYKPLTGRYELQLTGTCPNVLSQRRPIPYLTIEGAETEWASLVLFRQPEVLLRLVKPEGLTEIEPPPAVEAKSSLGRLFKAFAVDSRQIAEAELQVIPNRPQITCQQITLIRPETDQWLAEIDLHLQVQKGVVDEILLEAPPCWPGPYKTTPQISLSMKELAEGRRAIVLRPPLPVEQTYRIRITGPIHWPKNGPQELPIILPLQFPVTEHLLLLPIQDQLRPLVWQTQGLEKTTLPEALAQQLAGQGAWEAYRARTGQFTARLQPLAEQGKQPEVRLADIQLRWETDGLCSGKAWFYLLPAGQDHCVLCLPAGFRLLHAQLDNNPSPPIIQQHSQRYRLLLGSSLLPQVVEVSFLGILPPGVLEGLEPFPAPWLENCPVSVWLWTIYPPAGYELAEPEGVGRVSPLRLDAYRLRCIGSLLETGCRQRLEPNQEDFLRWYRVWRERFSVIVRQVQRNLALPPTSELHRTLRAEAQSFQLKLLQLAESLGLSDSPPPNASSPMGFADEAEVWFEWLKARGTVCRAVLHPPSQGLLLSYRPKKTSSILWRGLLASTGFCAAILLAWAAFKLLRHSTPGLWPPLLGALLGGIWWLWFWPSVLGCVFILLALLTAVVKVLPSYRTPRSQWRL
ncbi:MAG: hypothetical protein NZ602_07055 [Thermoguttaceae bacterium]|nr:hypothetical protein [Thermoguttaceae bacterium]